MLFPHRGLVFFFGEIGKGLEREVPRKQVAVNFHQTLPLEPATFA